MDCGVEPAIRRSDVKDINLVLRDRQVVLAELSNEIEALETAARALRPVAHLLKEENEERMEAESTGLRDGGEAKAAERTRVRRWV
jgi:hypothetical protein